MSEEVNPFWEFSLSVYDEAVAACCLALQDRCAVDVNLLLYGGWLARRGMRLTPDHLRVQSSAVAGWRDGVVKPLRQVRRQLGRRGPGAVLREDLKRLELAAERYQQDILYRGSLTLRGLPEVGLPMHENLDLVAALGGAKSSDRGPHVARLAALLSP